LRFSPPSKARLTEGDIAPTLVRLTIPMFFGIIAMIAFNLVDTYFVGQLGTRELAAISFTFPVVMILNSLTLGLGAGASAVISRAIGEGDPHQVRRLTTDALSLSLLIVALMATVGFLTIDPVFRLLGADEQTMPLIHAYMRIWYSGTIFVVVPMVGNNAIRATGDTKTPSLVMLVAVAVNIILDPVLIFGLGPVPRLGIAGAAIATVCARATTFFVALWVLYHREKMITLEIPGLQEGFASWRKILYIGLPVGGTNIIVPLSSGIITSLVASYGTEAVAGFGVGTRVEAFTLTVLFALNSVMSPFVGQNWGAQQYDRVERGIRYSQRFAFLWGGVMWLGLLVCGPQVARVFNPDPMVIATAVLYFSIAPIGYGLQGVLLLSNTCLNVLNRPFHSSLLTVIRVFGIYIPLAYLGSYLFGLQGIFGAFVISNMLTGSASYWWLQRVLRLEVTTS